MNRREIDEIWELMRETEKEIAKMRRESDKEIAKMRKEREKETRKMEKKRKEEMKEVDRRIGKLTDGWGRWVEGSMAPSAIKIFSNLGYKVLDHYFRRKMIEDGKVIGEIDSLIVGFKGSEKILFLGEARSFCSSEDVKEFKETIKKAREHFGEYKDYEMIGFVGGMNFGKGADTFAVREGFYVLKPSGETMVLDVPKGFEPKVF